MTPDFDRAATAAMEILIDQKVTETPIPSLQILLHFHKAAPKKDNSPIISFGEYMDYYEE